MPSNESTGTGALQFFGPDDDLVDSLKMDRLNVGSPSFGSVASQTLSVSAPRPPKFDTLRAPTESEYDDDQHERSSVSHHTSPSTPLDSDELEVPADARSRSATKSSVQAKETSPPFEEQQVFGQIEY